MGEKKWNILFAHFESHKITSTLTRYADNESMTFKNVLLKEGKTTPKSHCYFYTV